MSRNKFRARLFMAWLSVLAGLLLVVFVITVLATITSVTIISPTTASPAYSRADGTFSVQYNGAGDELVKARYYLTKTAVATTPFYTETAQWMLPATRLVTLTVPAVLEDGRYTVTVEIGNTDWSTTKEASQTNALILDSKIPTATIDVFSACVRTLSQFTGVMTDITSGVVTVTTKIQNSDPAWWNGTTWVSGAVWNLAAGTASPAVTGSWSYAAPTLVHNKFYSVTVDAGDGAGNAITPTDYVTSYFRLDTGAPTVAITTPPSGSPPSGWVNPTRVISVSGAVTDTAGECGYDLVTPYANAWVELKNVSNNRYWDGSTGLWVGSSVWNTKTSGTTTGWTYNDMPTLTDGLTYTIRARGDDTPGNSGYTAASTFYYDAISPTVTSGWPVTGTYYTTATVPGTVPTLIFTGTAGDTGSGVSKVQLMLARDDRYWNGAVWQPTDEKWFTATSTTSWTWSLTSTATYSDSKPYTLTARVTDNAGNVPDKEIYFYYDANAPTVYITPTTIVTCGVTSIGGTASDTFSGLDKDEVYVKIQDNTDGDWWNGSGWSTETPLTALTTNRDTVRGWITTTWTYTVTSAMLENDHSYTAWAQSQDNAGNQSTWLSRTFSYDACPTVTITAPGAGVKLSALSAFTGTTTDTSPGTVQTVTVQIECSHFTTPIKDWTNATNDSVADPWSNWHYTYGFTQTGQYTLSAQVKDNILTAVVVTRTFIFDTQAPTVTINTIGAQPTGFSGLVTETLAGLDWVTLAITDASGYYWNGAAWGAGATWFTPTVAITTWSLNITATTSPFQGGQTYTVTARAQDVAVASNTGASTTSFMYGYSRNIPLGGGWNLMSLPLIPNDTAIATVMSDVDVDWVDTFVWEGGVLTEKKWDLPIQQLTTMTTGQGYWAKMFSAGTLINAGLFQPNPPDVPKSYSVYAGWNMIGYHTTLASRLTSPVSVTAYLGTSVRTNTRAMYYYEGGAYQAVTDPNSELMKVGFGYWLALDAAGTIYP